VIGWEAVEGLPYPLGVSWCAADRAYNFALYSKHATAVRLVLFADDPRRPRLSRDLDARNHKSGRVWHCRVAEDEVRGCRTYGYVVDGPPPAGRFEAHAFRPDKVLLDPYATSIAFPEGFDRNATVGPRAALDGPRRTFDWGDDPRPRHGADAIVYELHVRGFTRDPSSGVSADARGTFAGVVEKIPYLRALGVNVVELMPIFEVDPLGGDYWGYMPLGFFAPRAAYAVDPGGALDELRAAVKALHAADIEVVLDVVYNHTAEGGADGPVYGFKGIDNSTYYLMNSSTPLVYADFAGAGNSINANNRYVRKMIVDSMRYWVREAHVDGFRIDLASVFGRREDGSLCFEDPPIFGDIAGDRDLERIRLIAEPWDAAGAYELGRAFPGITWLQWNSRFRDDVRRFVRGDAGMVGALMQRLYGSDDLFPDDLAHAYHAYQSVNYVTCHDGFTLHDLVAYDRKHNEANGEHGRDGAADNWSWNCGWEGEAGAPRDVLALRERQARNLCALVLLANGTPMLRAGDEMLHTQGGNNNAYNQDNATSWLDWRRRETHAGFHRFVREMIAFRKRHPSIGRSRFWREDVHWYGPAGGPDLASRCLAYCLRGASHGDADLYVMINAAADPVRFDIQAAASRPWRAVVDTARPSPEDLRPDGTPLDGASYVVEGRSVVVLEA
jgi:glycogen operon protein